jgi:hypothetical protein
MSDVLEDSLIRCPTCTATQPPAPACRRCKCDLSLYLATLDGCRQWRQLILQQLGDRRYEQALEAARQYATLSPDHDVARWIAIAHLLSGNFLAAVTAYERAASGGLA